MNCPDNIVRLAESHPRLQFKDAELGAGSIIDALPGALLKGGVLRYAASSVYLRAADRRVSGTTPKPAALN